MKFRSTSLRSQESFELERDTRETLPPATIPSPKDSEVRIKVTRLLAVVDIVTADLQLDPRSEDYIGDESMIARPGPRFCVLPVPAHSTPAKARVSQEPQHPQTMRSPVSAQKPITKAQARRARAKLAALEKTIRNRAS